MHGSMSSWFSCSLVASWHIKQTVNVMEFDIKILCASDLYHVIKTRILRLWGFRGVCKIIDIIDIGFIY